MLWKIEVERQEEFFDARGEGIKKDIIDLGISSVDRVRVIDVYLIEGSLNKKAVDQVCKYLLSDDIVQVYSFKEPLVKETAGVHLIEVAYNPGVMDPVEQSTKKAVADMEISGVESVCTARKYVIYGNVSKEEIHKIADKLLCNKTVQHIVTRKEKVTLPASDYRFKLEYVDILDASDEKLMEISFSRQLYLNLKEMHTIKEYFRKLGRNPTDCELETIAQTWSEHCVHKTFKGTIDYDGEIIDNLLKSTIIKVTEELNKEWCVSVFTDNAGIVKFDDKHNLCFKVETHNHPSALEPYGGAGTGIGGVIRDPLGTGLGAKPICNTDIFCFGPIDYPHDKLPKGTLHPKRIMKGVVAGVRDYGNRMGIPTVNGGVFFGEGYIGNPVVYCGNLGLIPADKCKKEVSAGDKVVLLGGRTGRDGIHGVTFASSELTDASEVISSGAVQIGNPIAEKKMVDTLIQARNRGLYKFITDCGGGGLSSAVGEAAKDTGVVIDLEKVPLKYSGLSYMEIWISESQERMIVGVPEENVEQLLNVFKNEDVEATVIGEFTADKRLKLRYDGNIVCDLDMEFLHNGLPKKNLVARWISPKFEEPNFKDPSDLTPYLKKLLSSPNICSKEWVIRQYDHEVQGGSVIKPLTGVNNDGPSDAAVMRPVLDSHKGVVISNGMNPNYGVIDPYWMAASAIDEALRNVVAVGGTLEKTALLDNFSWGNPDKPDRLAGLVRASKACYDIAKIYGTPFISGKDSLNNEYKVGDESVSIPPTLLISALSVMDDVRNAVTMDGKEEGDLVYVIGRTKNELGGSHYYTIRGWVGNNLPKVDAKLGKKTMQRLNLAIKEGIIRACHDLSEGGLGVALAESSFSGDLGIEVDLRNVPVEVGLKRNDTILFSESNSRFIVEVAPRHKKQFENIMKGIPFGLIGEIKREKVLKIIGLKGKTVLNTPIQKLKAAWQKGLGLN